jgi:hypothetical protein
MLSTPPPDDHIIISLKKGSRFPYLMNGIFRQGVQVEIRIGSSIRDVVVNQLGMAEDYLENRVQTIFLNGKPVDNVDDARVSDNSVLALSAAMPGLAGATLRKSGKYAAFRQGISLHGEPVLSEIQQKGWMILKLFNQVAEEQGAVLLVKGVWIDSREMLNVLHEAQKQSLMQDVEKVEMNGNLVLLEYLDAVVSSKSKVFLSLA